MNAKIAKMYRSRARAMTEGEPHEVYRRSHRPGMERTIEVHPSCTKGVYRALKKIHRINHNTR